MGGGGRRGGARPGRNGRNHDGAPGIVRELRRKFVVSAMAAVALVLVGIVVALDVTYYVRLVSRADAQLEAVVASGGSLEALVDQGFGRQPPMQAQSPAGLQQAGASPEGSAARSQDASAASSSSAADAPAVVRQGQAGSPLGHGLLSALFGDAGFSAETPYEMRFFTVTIGADGAVESVDVSRIASVDEAQAAQLALEAQDAGSSSGFLGGRRYLVSAADGSTTVAFLDCTQNLASFRSLLVMSVLAVVLATGLVFVLVLAFSRRALAPVAESYRRQRRFITDASHDLKTPLAVIGASTDVIEIESGPSEWTRSIRHQVQRMTDLTNELVTLARMDEGAGSLSPADFDLAALARKVSLDFEPVAVATGREILCDAPEALPCRADPALLEQAVSLLVDNALKYSTEGSTVRVEVRPGRAGRSRVTVENACGPVDAGEHPELFDRFYRSDESRASSEGHGIGLAVVRAIAEAHGGSVSAESPDGASMRFVMVL